MVNTIVVEDFEDIYTSPKTKTSVEVPSEEVNLLSLKNLTRALFSNFKVVEEYVLQLTLY